MVVITYSQGKQGIGVIMNHNIKFLTRIGKTTNTLRQSDTVT